MIDSDFRFWDASEFFSPSVRCLDAMAISWRETFLYAVVHAVNKAMYSEWPKVSNQAAKICVHYQSFVSNI